MAALLIDRITPFVSGFRSVLVVAILFGVLATLAQHRLYDADGDSYGKSFEGLETIRSDLGALPETLGPLLMGDTLVRFANGMVYVFFVIVVVERLGTGLTLAGLRVSPAAFFGLLVGLEMVVAILTMIPVSLIGERVGLKRVVTGGFLVYATFPLLLILAPPNQWVLIGLFAFSGLRFAGLPAHKALIVGPAEADTGGRVTGTYYLVRNAMVIPAGVLGGYLYGIDPVYAFGTATVVGLAGTILYGLVGDAFAPASS